MNHRFSFESTPSAGSSRFAPAALRQRLLECEAWLELRLDWLMLLLVLVGAYRRIRLADASYLNADETQIMYPPLQHGLLRIERAAFNFPYGPLMNYVLHFMTWFGGSELYFRMPSVIAGTLLAFVGYRWAAETFGKGAGLVTGFFLTFAPSLVILSAQVRHYITHAFFIACSLYCLERALRERSPGWMSRFAVAMLLAVLTMYMSIWYIAALGAYAVVCFFLQRIPWAVINQWVMAHAVAALVIGTAYLTHLRKLRGDRAERLARDGWLRASYYHPGVQTLWNYLQTATGELFAYVFSIPTLSEWTFLAFVAGIVLVLSGRAGLPDNRRTPALALVFPLLVTAAAGTVGVYPYGGSRHDAFLAIFILAGVAIAISAAVRGKIIVLTLLAAGLLPLWLSHAQRNYLDELPQVCKAKQMRRALKFLSQRDPRPAVLLIDQIGTNLVDYYVCHGAVSRWRRLMPGSSVYRCADYTILTINDWGVSSAEFPVVLAKARAAMPHMFPDPVWVFYVSPVRATDESWTTDNRAVFGKIEIYRISP